MKLLIFNPYYKDVTLKIIEAIRDLHPCEIVDTLDHFSFRTALTSCLSGETVIVFFVFIEKDMTFLEDIYSKFFDVKLIVNHPDHLDQYQTRILNLYPRMLTVTEKCSLILPGAVRGIVKQKLTDNIITNNNNIL
jgi:hypothetical protein